MRILESLDVVCTRPLDVTLSLDFGELTATPGETVALDPGVFIASATHDYTVVDVTESETQYRSGDSIGFTLNYSSAASAFASPVTRVNFLSEIGNEYEKAYIV
jgi:predicted amino acid racemase